ncbi:MAG: hypothetical protein HOH04_04530 [Rhodospirillaceae bacterium]|nr:hypothetical protein [Rhodospirillaceae bacterium]
MTTNHSSDAEQLPLISEFLGLVAATAPTGRLSLDDVESRSFMKFWRHLIIFRHEPTLQDFRVSFFGTEVVKCYGEDWSGRLLSDSGFTLGFDKIYRVNREVMESQEIVSESGVLDWLERDYVKWHQVKLPLSRAGEITDVLTIICFE